MRNARLTVGLIVAINLVVFLAWRTLDPRFMVANFTTSWTLAFARGRYWTLLTSVFSHESLIHFVINMLVLNSFGSILASVLGVRRFLGFYLVAGIVASISHDVVSNLVLGSPGLGAVGASGAVAGLVLLFALMFPREKLLIFGLIPLPALFGALVFVGLDIWGLFAQFEGGGLPLGHGAHLGGAFAGALYYGLFLRRRRRISGL